jgi:hypothetical protein
MPAVQRIGTAFKKGPRFSRGVLLGNHIEFGGAVLEPRPYHSPKFHPQYARSTRECPRLVNPTNFASGFSEITIIPKPLALISARL